jgi:hypothetical protein
MGTSVFLEALRSSVGQPTNGIIGVVDDLLDRCGDSGLQLEWREDRCIARLPGNEETAELPLRKSVLRALLARVALLCGEHVSPSGGSGELLPDSGPAYHVKFVNTTGAQWLELIPAVPLISQASCAPLPRQASSHSPGS